MSEGSRKGKRGPLTASTPAATGQRRDAAKKRREERMKAYQRNKRQLLLTKIVAIGLGLALIGGVVYVIVDRSQSAADAKVPDGVKSYTYAGGQHDDAFNAWTEVPPVGGTHNNSWQKCGYYAAPVLPGMGVHVLEHGGVWITYSRDLPQDQVDKLKQLAEDQDEILVSPYDGLPAPIVASAWNRQLTIDNADSEALGQFIRAFKNADSAPEPNASCSDGSTVTM